MDIVDRIFALADAKFDEQKKFAQAIQVPPSVISAWRMRKSTSYNKRIPQLAELLNTTVVYLMTGEDETPADQPANGREEEFVRLFQQLTPEQQNLVLAQLKGIVNTKDK